ncbi:hypothetical protein Ndes2437B_g02782 [Nannochloris sp. 'desiccata']
MRRNSDDEFSGRTNERSVAAPDLIADVPKPIAVAVETNHLATAAAASDLDKIINLLFFCAVPVSPREAVIQWSAQHQINAVENINIKIILC